MKMLKRLEKDIANSAPPSVFCAAVNFKNLLKRRPYKLRPADEGSGKFYTAEDDRQRLVFCRRGRHKRYIHGVLSGVDDLAQQYSLDTLAVEPGGVFIDCGANIGELGIWARARGFEYIAIEPEQLEADCCDINNFEALAKTHRVALWKEDTTLEFHSKPDSADSSVFDMGNAVSVKIPARKLDSLIDLSSSKGTNVLKLEAEGAEPEVLEGAEETLKLIDYVAVDCGYERGKEKKHTFIEVNRFLSARGFEPVEAKFRRVTVLYKNTNR